MGPVTKRGGGGGATIGAGGNVETDMDASLGVLQALGNGQLSPAPAASTQREAVHKAAAVM
jgi:hypothetical protein